MIAAADTTTVTAAKIPSRTHPRGPAATKGGAAAIAAMMDGSLTFR